MPYVAGKHYPYTKAGYKAAARARALKRRADRKMKHERREGGVERAKEHEGKGY